MKDERPPEGNANKAEANDIARPIESTPMGKFQSLARGLLSVTRAQLEEEQATYEGAKKTSPRRKRIVPSS